MVEHKSKFKVGDRVWHPKQCRKLVKKPSQSIVTTSKGFKFKAITTLLENKKSYQDLATGLIWHPKEDGKFSHHQAVAKLGNSLPTKKEFEVAEQHGIREVFLDFSDSWFWSASVHPFSSDFGYYFNGFNGYIDFGYRDNFNGSVRCVGR